MSILGKIKYYFDGAEEAEESGLILSRRKFFIASAALLIVPKIVDGLSAVEWTGDIEWEGPPAADFLAPGALDLIRYQDEIIQKVKKTSPLILKPSISKIHFTKEELQSPSRYFEQMAIPAMKLGYRGERM